MRKLFVIPVLVCLFLSCSKDSNGDGRFYGTVDEPNAMVKDITGFDGCGVIIVLDTGERLEVAEIPLDISLTPDRRVGVLYKILKNRVSACMIGPSIRIVDLRYF